MQDSRDLWCVMDWMRLDRAFVFLIKCHATFSLSASLGPFERGLRKKARKKSRSAPVKRARHYPGSTTERWAIGQVKHMEKWMRANRQKPLDMDYLIYHQVYRFTPHIIRFTSLPALNSSFNTQHSLSLFHFNNILLPPDTSLAA